MRTYMPSLPPEVLDLILIELEWLDILRLRMTCKALDTASRSRVIWASQCEKVSAKYDVPLEFGTDATSSTEEVESELLDWMRSERGWMSSEPPSRRVYGTYDGACVQLVEGGRWLLCFTSGGSTIAHDLDSLDGRRYILIPPPDKRSHKRIAGSAIHYIRRRPNPEFYLAVTYQNQNEFARIFIYRIKVGESGRLAATHLTSFNTLCASWSHLACLDEGRFLRLQEKDFYLDVYDWHNSTTLCHRKVSLTNDDPYSARLLPCNRLLALFKDTVQVLGVPAMRFISGPAFLGQRAPILHSVALWGTLLPGISPSSTYVAPDIDVILYFTTTEGVFKLLISADDGHTPLASRSVSFSKSRSTVSLHRCLVWTSANPTVKKSQGWPFTLSRGESRCSSRPWEVGAGPTGLVLAISLALNGINVRVIEKDPVCKPRSLEMHHFLGTASDILSSASQVPQMVAYPIGSTVPIKTMNVLSDAAEPSDAFPTTRAVLLGQDKQVEILTAHFQKLGGLVERGVELVSFEQSSDNVIALLRHPGGEEPTEERATFDYLVGADGAHSQTRQQLGLSFLGETRKAQQMIIGLFFLFTPAYEENLRLMADHEELVGYLRKMTGLPDLDCDKSALLTMYTPNIRMVDSFRKGRVFIAGDAAHVHSPAGGQGSNSGAQDAFNLGWKLALVVKGLAKPRLLDSYDAERLPVIAEMLQLTSALHDKTYEGGLNERVWNRGSHLDQLGVNYRGTPFLLDEIEGRPPSTSNCYDSRPSGVLMAGDRAPDASSLVSIRGVLTSDRLFDLFSVARHTILVFAGQQGNPEASLVAQLLKAYTPGLFKSVGVLPSDSSTSLDVGLDLVVKDELGNAHKAYGVPGADTVIVAVRPDGAVGAMIADSNGLRRYLDLACF
ncbi:hypothetical protein CCMSSC00406_0009379 [Pleurotus cornucopiae]|uniref:Uncharacterized protein n=1 Tax=Pleurotus cornucopiae TaxID=5321 RepID=A0ACB7IQL8_PLECO|nr:hypothetical protein CCMSSC00406_0009379 [Pleurotus cornucopiae]